MIASSRVHHGFQRTRTANFSSGIGHDGKSGTTIYVGIDFRFQTFESDSMIPFEMNGAKTFLSETFRKYRPPSKPTILALSGIATVFSITSLADCSFMKSANENTENAVVGLFSQAVFDTDGRKLGCVKYTNKDAFDTLFRTGRAFGVLACLGCCTAFIFLAVSVLVHPQKTKWIWKAAQYIIIFSTVFQMFTFFTLGSNFVCSQYDCSLAGQGILSIINSILLVGLSVYLYLEDAPTQPWLTRWEATPTTNHDESVVARHPIHAPGVNPEVMEFLANHPNKASRTYRHEVEMGFPHGHVIHNIGSLTHHRTTNGLDNNGVGFQGMIGFRLVLLALFTCAWAVTVAGVSGCTFIMVGLSGGAEINLSGIGLFTRSVYEDDHMIGCLAYPQDVKIGFDQVFLASRVFGTVSAMLMSVVYILHVSQIFVHGAKEEIWLAIRVLLPSVTVFQLLVFIAYRTNTCTEREFIECVPGQLGIWVILNVILLASLTVVTFLMPAPAHPLVMRYFPPGQEMKLSTLSRRLDQSSRRVLEPGSLMVVGAEPLARSEDEETANESYIGDPPERILKIRPFGTSSLVADASEKEAELITVAVEFVGNEKRTIKTLTHPDGSKTITTTIEELSDHDEEEEDVEQEPETESELEEIGLLDDEMTVSSSIAESYASRSTRDSAESREREGSPATTEANASTLL